MKGNLKKLQDVLDNLTNRIERRLTVETGANFKWLQSDKGIAYRLKTIRLERAKNQIGHSIILLDGLE